MRAVPPAAGNGCTSGTTIPNSNRSHPVAACAGDLGSECPYQCDPGYLSIGRHVCQTFSQGGTVWLNRTFFGGRCVRICPASSAPCPAGEVPTRFPSSDAVGECLHTVCSTPDAALRKLARGNYALWSRLARNNFTGIYLAGVDLTKPAGQQPQAQGATGETGLGLAIECVADAMGWTSRADAQASVLLTLRTLSGQTSGFSVAKNRRGFMPTFVDARTGQVWGNSTGTQQFALMSTDLLHAGILFASTYYRRVDPGSPSTEAISALAAALFAGTAWDTLLCNAAGRVDPNGTYIPMLFDWDDGCSALMPLQADGLYDFNEEFISVWLAMHRACSGSPPGRCPNAGVQRMWDRWQGRRSHPMHSYNGRPLLSEWAAYVVQLPYYMAHPFNSDPLYTDLFASHWRAEMDLYTNSYYAGDGGRYGLGAGPVDPACADGGLYLSDTFCVGGAPCQDHCRMYSPYSVAGYLPASPDTIRPHLLSLLASGDAVYTLPTCDCRLNPVECDFVLWRRSLLHLDWTSNPPQTYVSVTTVDISAELFGLSTLWLGCDFYVNNTNHWPR
eukprot:gene10498-1910_t